MNFNGWSSNCEVLIGIYQQGNSSATKEVSKNGTITTVDKPKSINMTAMLSWANVMNLFNVFDVRVSFSLIRENLGTLLSVSHALKKQLLYRHATLTEFPLRSGVH